MFLNWISWLKAIEANVILAKEIDEFFKSSWSFHLTVHPAQSLSS